MLHATCQYLYLHCNNRHLFDGKIILFVAFVLQPSAMAADSSQLALETAVLRTWDPQSSEA